ncbi:colanic acid biosynthesis glycosyltransferase WcaI [Pontibacter sp. SGAir0037]|nr:colanic acid biosynthesis glycosyltransferase WcaI [Pontibacter sp. SGAir0037]
MIGYNFHPEPTGIGKYSGEMISWLAKNGYDCTVLTSYPYYPYWKVQEPYRSDRFWYKTEYYDIDKVKEGGKLKVIRCPQYVPANPTGLKRMILDLTFLLTAGLKLLQFIFTQKFDTVIAIAPSFQFGLLGVLYKKLRNAKFFYHIQDLQIEAARDLRMIKSEKILKGLFSLEKYILNQADYISSISEGMIQRIRHKANKDVLLFPNWADINFFYPVQDKSALKVEFGFKPTDTIILYSGAMGEKQGLEAILYAAKELSTMEGVKFLICGSGPYKEKLQSLSGSLNLTNVIFYPLQPIEKFNQFLNTADIHLIIQKANASDLVMPSKLTNVLAVGGLALITANRGSGLYELVNKYKMGLLVDAENQAALTEGIKLAISDNNEKHCQNARLYAERYLSREIIMTSFEDSVIGREELAEAYALC